MNESLGRIIDMADSYPFEPGDYMGEDGCMRCCVCDQPKQCRPTWPPELRGLPEVVRCACPCETDEMAKRDMDRRRQGFEATVKGLWERDGLTCFDLLKVRPDNGSNAKIASALQKIFVDNWAAACASHLGVAIHGAVGTGKTYLAYRVGAALLRHGVRVAALSISRLAGTDFGDAAGRIARTYDLLILDDVGQERDSGYVRDIAYNIIDARYRDGRPVIVTTNLKWDKQKGAMGLEERVSDRLAEMCPLDFRLDGPSQRAKMAADRKKDISVIMTSGRN